MLRKDHYSLQFAAGKRVQSFLCIMHLLDFADGREAVHCFDQADCLAHGLASLREHYAYANRRKHGRMV